MAVRGIFGFYSFEAVDARLSGCQVRNLRGRAQAMRRSQSDGDLVGWFACRDKRCRHPLGPLDVTALDDELCEREWTMCGATSSVDGGIFGAVILLLDLQRCRDDLWPGGSTFISERR